MAVQLRRFRAFVAVAEEAHIGRAARRLFVSQPALSRQMQQLEGELGVELLRRTSRGVELTDAGGELLRRARVLLQATEEALTVGRSGEPEGTLTLGVTLAAVNDDWFAILRDLRRATRVCTCRRDMHLARTSSARSRRARSTPPSSWHRSASPR